jgi:hypothetical protein
MNPGAFQAIGQLYSTAVHSWIIQLYTAGLYSCTQLCSTAVQPPTVRKLDVVALVAQHGGERGEADGAHRELRGARLHHEVAQLRRRRAPVVRQHAVADALQQRLLIVASWRRERDRGVEVCVGGERLCEEVVKRWEEKEGAAFFSFERDVWEAAGTMSGEACVCVWCVSGWLTGARTSAPPSSMSPSRSSPLPNTMLRAAPFTAPPTPCESRRC